jgi:hypothetical protein
MPSRNRSIRLVWSGFTEDGYAHLRLDIVPRSVLSRCTACVRLPRDFEARDAFVAARQILRMVRATWRTVVLGEGWVERRRERWEARVAAEIQEQHERLLNPNPAQRLVSIEAQAYRSRWSL